MKRNRNPQKKSDACFSDLARFPFSLVFHHVLNTMHRHVVTFVVLAVAAGVAAAGGCLDPAGNPCACTGKPASGSYFLTDFSGTSASCRCAPPPLCRRCVCTSRHARLLQPAAVARATSTATTTPPTASVCVFVFRCVRCIRAHFSCSRFVVLPVRMRCLPHHLPWQQVCEGAHHGLRPVVCVQRSPTACDAWNTPLMFCPFPLLLSRLRGKRRRRSRP